MYQDLISKTSHLALVKGDIDKEKPTLVRVHVQNTIQDIIHTKNSKSWPLENAIKKINNSDSKLENILKTTSFDYMKNMETTNSFDEAMPWVNFFRKGKKDNWKIELDSASKKKIEENLKKEMSELEYI